MKLSVIITTLNEEPNISRALESVAWADDILIVDSFSTDRTVEIAREYTDRILERPYQGPADQKNWAIPQARHEWILLLDADERVTPELRAEIEHWLAQDNIPYDAFWIRRRSFFMGQAVRYSGWQGDRVVRFFRRDQCRYDDKQVHEEIVTKGLRVSTLQHILEHYTYRDLNHFLAKMQRYGEWSARDHLARTPRVTGFHLAAKPLFRFLKHFIIQRGFLDGRVGFIISVIMAWGVFLRYTKLEEMQRELQYSKGKI